MIQTSLLAYNVRIKPHLSFLQEKIIEALHELGGATIKEVAEHTGLDKSCVSGRMKELSDMGILNERVRGENIRNGGYIRWIN